MPAGPDPAKVHAVLDPIYDKIRAAGEGAVEFELYDDGEFMRLIWGHWCKDAPSVASLPVGGEDGWELVRRDPLTIAPSILCVPPEGCGLHGHVRAGVWRPC